MIGGHFVRLKPSSFWIELVNKDHRPINVGPADLMRFRWPPMAIASITHRISGVIVFVGIAFMLYAFDLSLSSEAGFQTLTGLLASPVGKLITFGILAAFGYHFVAGIKHLLLDLEWGESLEGGLFASKVTMLFAAIVIVLAGIWVLQL